jgi:hypothetical protein
MPQKIFTVRVGCQSIGAIELFKLRAASGDAAWKAALEKFFDKNPAALERGLTVRGSIRAAN